MRGARKGGRGTGRGGGSLVVGSASRALNNQALKYLFEGSKVDTKTSPGGDEAKLLEYSMERMEG